MVLKRGTVGKNEWLNEIHPTSKAFAKVTDKVFAAMAPFLSP